jgi:hypothetical protein
MGHLLKLKYAHSSVLSAYLASTSVPFGLTAVQMPNLALIEMKGITVNNLGCHCAKLRGWQGARVPGWLRVCGVFRRQRARVLPEGRGAGVLVHHRPSVYASASERL